VTATRVIGPAGAVVDDVIRGLTGLAFPESRREVLAGGVARGMRRAGTLDPSAYLERLRADPAELDALVAEITVGETYFFRDPEQFRVIREEILPALLRDHTRRPLRVWSAGCASGEEPYTLAIVLREVGAGSAAQIVGTDISRPALAAARRADYGRWSLRTTAPDIGARYFERVGTRFVLAPAIRRLVEFRYLNLAADSFPSLASGVWGLDLILCRNVLIYFDTDTVRQVAGRLVGALAPDGWLVLGASDPPLAGLAACDVVVTAAGLAYRRAEQGNVHRIIAPARADGAPVAPVSRLEPLAVPAPAPLEPAVPSEPAAGRAGLREIEDAVRAYEARDYTGAAVAARRVIHGGNGDPAAWVTLVRSLANTGDLESAGRACAAALERHRMSAEIAYLHGVLLAEAGRLRQAADALRRALYLDRELVVAHLALAAVLAREGDVGGARRALRNATRALGPAPGMEAVPASDGAPAARLAAAARAHLSLLGPEPA